VCGAVALCLVLSGCGVEPPPRLTAALRFIELGPQELFEPSDIAVKSTVFRLEPNPTGGEWEIGGAGVAAGERQGRLLVKVSEEGTVSFTRRLDVPPAEVEVIEVELGWLRPSNSVRLYWAEDGKEFKKSGSIRFGARQGEGSRYRLFRFGVGTNPTWSASVRTLRIEVASESQNVLLGPVVGHSLELNTARSKPPWRTVGSASWRGFTGVRFWGIQASPSSAGYAFRQAPNSALLRVSRRPNRSRWTFRYG